MQERTSPFKVFPAGRKTLEEVPFRKIGQGTGIPRYGIIMSQFFVPSFLIFY